MNAGGLRVRHPLALPSCAGILLLTLACRGGTERGSRNGGGAALESAPVVQLTRLAASPENLDLTTVTGLDVDSRGQIYIADFPSLRITVLSEGGDPVRTVGRRGSGPGEFQFIRGVQILPGDTLLVYDQGKNRVTAFPPGSDSAAYNLNLAVTTGSGPPDRLYRLPASGGFVATYVRPYRASDDPRHDGNRYETLRLLDVAGRIRRDSVLRFPAEEYLVARERGLVAVTLSPFGRRSVFDVGPDGNVYHGSADSSTVSVYSPEGSRLAGFRVPELPEPVTREQVDTLVAAMGQPFSRALRANVPEAWGSFHRLMVDDRTVWVEQGGPRRRLVAFDSAGRITGVALLPRGFEPRRVRYGRVYGVQKGADGVPQVIVYRLGPAAASASHTKRM